MCETSQKFVAAVLMHNGLANDCAKRGHASCEPLGDAAVMKGEIGATGAVNHALLSRRTGGWVECNAASGWRQTRNSSATREGTLRPTQRFGAWGLTGDALMSITDSRGRSWAARLTGPSQASLEVHLSAIVVPACTILKITGAYPAFHVGGSSLPSCNHEVFSFLSGLAEVKFGGAGPGLDMRPPNFAGMPLTDIRGAG